MRVGTAAPACETPSPLKRARRDANGFCAAVTGTGPPRLAFWLAQFRGDDAPACFAAMVWQPRLDHAHHQRPRPARFWYRQPASIYVRAARKYAAPARIAACGAWVPVHNAGKSRPNPSAAAGWQPATDRRAVDRSSARYAERAFAMAGGRAWRSL